MKKSDLLKKQNERLDMMRDIEQQLIRLNAIERYSGKSRKVEKERKALRLTLIKLVAWTGACAR